VPSAEPYIRVQTCTPSGGCVAGGQLAGGFFTDAAEIRATINVANDLGESRGGLVAAGRISVYHGTGVVWFPEETSHEAFVTSDYTIPSRVPVCRWVLSYHLRPHAPGLGPRLP
jgi:hypothetical protein